MARCKRTPEMNKYYKRILKDLDGLLGEADAGLFLSIVVKMIIELAADKDRLNLRTMEIKFNDFFSKKWDFDHNCFVND